MSKLIDLTDKIIGDWQVIKRVENNSCGSAMWLCKCQFCGKEQKQRGSDLNTGKKIHCTCYNSRSRLKDEIGNKYGKLTVIGYAGKNQHRHAKWLCECECGGKIITLGKYLRNGDTKSCGCLSSAGELLIRQLLNKNKINYYTQYSYNDLQSKQGFPLYFDFALFDANNNFCCLIEYQGTQHFFNKGEFGKIQREETDILKRQYCEINHIPLEYINYNDDVQEKLDKIFKKYNLICI